MPKMAVICPTVTAYEPHQYREQIERLLPFAHRIHIDLMDGQLAPTVSPPLESIWLPHEFTVDIHLMYQRPGDYLAQLIKLMPSLVVIHAEADVDHTLFAAELHKADIQTGLALLQHTSVESVESIINSFDHVLVFSGNLGHHGGMLDMGLIGKVTEVRELHPEAEISWDGGITDQNAAHLIRAGVDVLNVGGFIQKSSNPAASYATLESLAG
jgi:ribulose-phosphate 3-epimerase